MRYLNFSKQTSGHPLLLWVLLGAGVASGAPQDADVAFVASETPRDVDVAFVAPQDADVAFVESPPVASTERGDLAQDDAETEAPDDAGAATEAERPTTPTAEAGGRTERPATTRIEIETERLISSTTAATESDRALSPRGAPLRTFTRAPRPPRPAPRFLSKLSYYSAGGGGGGGGGGGNLLPGGGKETRGFKSRCRCERIWNCPKLQITVPRCPDEYFLCCF
ncbi:uncharacterized protein LOC112050722 isoform X2 [Bicyclus anynana]|uniref:Uncharacterized protein LOC112050722 isoform X2 n=1 Tax=Bicyclus anynana TaxID=110368 RepID=A0ABM3LJG4_BICAN|nr:uncharacterized protein LOC112050722 isoform X2 [Bicyclus anynana]